MPNQANTQRGKVVFPSNSALLGKNGLLVVIIAGGLIDLPSAVTDLGLFVIADGKVNVGDPVEVDPLFSEQEVRIVAKGTGSAGDVLVHADPGTPADKGKVRSFTGSVAPVTAGQYFSPGIAEEDFVDGQAVLIRPEPRFVRIASALTLGSATTAAATDLTTSEALANAAKADLILIKAVLQAQGLVA